MDITAEIDFVTSEQRAVLLFFAGPAAGAWRVHESEPAGTVLRRLSDAGLVTLNPYPMASATMYRPIITTAGNLYLDTLVDV